MLLGCFNCARKHLATAIALIDEFWEGYEGHDWLAMGELNLAAREIRMKSPELAEIIRGERKNFEADRTYRPGLLDLIIAVTDLERREDANDSKRAAKKKRKGKSRNAR